MIFNMVFGGGSDSSSVNSYINVVGGTSAPASPTLNTIWVNTEATFDSWMVSPSEPNDLGWYGVWIQTGTSGSVSINVTGDDNRRVYIYPIAAKQWDTLGGKWLERGSKFWNGSSWIDIS